MSATTRVLVCDESPAYARSLARYLGVGGQLEVVGVCASGEDAVGALRRVSPDLVTIDLHLPGMGGIRAIEEIMRAHPVPIVVVSASAGHGSPLAADALAAGALHALPKALIRLDEPDGPAAVALRHRLMRFARNGVNHGSEELSSGRARLRARATVVGICASAGGPAALEAVLTALPAGFSVPVLVVQHMSVGFIGGLVRRLDEHAALPVRFARDGQAAGPGIWFPPEDTHLLLGRAMGLALDSELEVGLHRPSADVLLKSLAASAGAGAVGVILTGMGRDGARGVGAICRAGGFVIAQDEATSAVFGMPKAAIDAGAQTILPVSQIAAALSELAAREVEA